MNQPIFVNIEGRAAEGLLPFQNELVYVHIKAFEQSLKINIEDNFEHKDLISMRLGRSMGSLHKIDEAIEELTYLFRQLQRDEDIPFTPFAISPLLIEDINCIGWDKVTDVDDSFKHIEFRLNDESGRSHFVSACVASHSLYRQIPLVDVKYDLPGDVFTTVHNNFVDLINGFQLLITSLSYIWDDFDEIDEQCAVIEPRISTRSREFFRRVRMDKLTSLLISVDPKNPDSIPHLSVLGPNVGQVREQICKWLPHWDRSQSILGNLLNVIGIEFASKDSANCGAAEDALSRCGICFVGSNDSFDSEGAENNLSVTCSNEKCGQLFHRDCLLEWFKTLPSVKKCFNVIFGECPYCKIEVSIKNV